MPLTQKGKTILREMIESYKSKKKAIEILHRSINAGKIKGAHKGGK